MSLPGQPPPGGNPQAPGAPSQAPAQTPQYLPMSAQSAAQQQQDLTNRGIGVGGEFGDINWYKWKEATKAENQANGQAGENLLWILPKLATHPNPDQLGRMESSHYLKHLNRGFRCVESMFPERRDARCPICDVLRQVSQMDGVDSQMVKKQAPNMKFNLSVVDMYDPAKGVQVASFTAQVYQDMLAHLRNDKIQDPLRDFTNPYAARPWQIFKIKANIWKYNASIYGGMNPQPMAWLQDGQADVNTINSWLVGAPNLWEIITWPNDERMVELNATAYDLLRFYQQQASAVGGSPPASNNYPTPGAPAMSMPGMPAPGAPALGAPALGAPGIAGPMVPGVPGPAAPATLPQTPQTPQQQPQAPAAVYNPPATASSPMPGVQTPAAGPGYNPENMPPLPGETPGVVPSPQADVGPQPAEQAPTADPGAPPVAPAPAVPVQTTVGPPPIDGQVPPGVIDQSAPPPTPMPGQNATGGPVCFGQHSDQRIMCTTCSKNTVCAEATPKTG